MPFCAFNGRLLFDVSIHVSDLLFDPIDFELSPRPCLHADGHGVDDCHCPVQECPCGVQFITHRLEAGWVDDIAGQAGA